VATAPAKRGGWTLRAGKSDVRTVKSLRVLRGNRCCGNGEMDIGGSKVRRSARWGCACIVLMLSATVCLSYDAKGFVSFGVGNKSCDQYVSDAQQPDRGFVYETWLSGYLTAFNAYNPGVSDILIGMDFDGAVAWIKSYCREHPTAVVHMAAVKFIQFMQQKTDVTDSKPARLASL
jgi:hypothetical protein